MGEGRIPTRAGHRLHRMAGAGAWAAESAHSRHARRPQTLLGAGTPMLHRPLVRLTIIGAVLLLPGGAWGQATPPAATLRSPDGRIEVRVTSAPLEYSIQFKGQPVVLQSPLGLSFRGLPDISDWQVARSDSHRVDRTLRPAHGKTSAIRDRFQELDLILAGRSDRARQLELQVRAYDDGVAFRYVVPRQPALDTFVITRELTAFRFAGD